MKVLLSWLRQFAPLDDDPVALGERMSALGMAVESLERRGEGLDGVVVARVVELRPHPNADRIQLVDVELGSGEPTQVCCGAFNLAVGDLVPLATDGAVLPGGVEIRRRQLRGEWSDGMLCSPVELRLGHEAGSILVLPQGLELGAPLAEALGLSGDVLYDLEINPNRPDAMSVAGVARDLAASYGVPFALPRPTLAESPARTVDLASVEVVDRDLCGRFVGRVVNDVRVGPSAPWIAARLTLLGMRPINNVVDASNYVMLELGQPNHPYDLDRLPGRGLRVRRAGADETLVTLDEVERTFTSDDLLICDATDSPVGIAGVMGGASTEIAADTTAVLLEAAWFSPMAVARTSRRLGLRTEASARFERGCDPEGIDLAVARFAELLAASGATTAAGDVDIRGQVPSREAIRLRTTRVNAVLGTALAASDVRRLLEPIGFTVATVDGDHDVTAPSFRPDTTSEIDLIEEVARHHGYERIAPEAPPSARTGALSTRQQERRRVREVMVGLGLSEAMPLPFLAPGDLERAGLPGDGMVLTNPLVAEESVLRTSLLPGLLRALAYNASHRNEGVALFEVGHVFRVPPAGAELPDEREHVAAALAGREALAAVEVWSVLCASLGVGHPVLEADEIAGLHPTRTARAVVEGETVGAVGEVDPGVLAAHGIAERVAWLEVNLDRLLDLPHRSRRYHPVSRYPSSDIDLAFEVDEATPAAAVDAILRETTGELLARLTLFDVFRGPPVAGGRRSLAYSLRLQAPDRTLTDEEIAAVRRRAIEAVEARLPARLRG